MAFTANFLFDLWMGFLNPFDECPLVNCMQFEKQCAEALAMVLCSLLALTSTSNITMDNVYITILDTLLILYTYMYIVCAQYTMSYVYMCINDTRYYDMNIHII